MPKPSEGLLKAKEKLSKIRLTVYLVVFGLVGAAVLIFVFASPNPNLPGDLNGDNKVDALDLSILLGDYGTTNSAADINGDGHVNVLDLSALLSHYGQTTSASCTVSAKLVNSCRPWLGGFAANYSQTTSGFKAQINYQEQRIGRQLDMVHNYHPSSSNSLSADDITLAKRANTILYINWKPNSGTTWAQTGSGTNSTANTGIDNMANSIKSVAPAKIMVALWGEPERSVSSSPTCGASWPGYKSTAAGFSTTDYVNMWHNVENRFAADGVTNVVWVLNLTGFSTWQCMVKDLWPGNSDIDWVMWDPYAGNSDTFASSMGYFYNWMGSNSDASHDFNSKAWGLAEYGSSATTQSTVYSYYDSIKTALDSNTYPKLKAYIEFDNVGTWDTRTMYNYKGDTTTSGQLANDTIDNTEQSHYDSLADDPRFTDAFYNSGQTSCSVNTALVSSCRPWLGAAVNNYTSATADQTQFDAAESRQGRPYDIIHTYHPVGSNSLSATDIHYAQRANTMLFTNWKPGSNWSQVASGQNDAAINSMANSIKSLGSTKIFLTIWHEPENDVSPNGDPNCNITYKGSAGTVSDYVNMWHHVRTVFNADGVSNVVWAIDYMNYPPWNCLVPDLYPGDSYVDWIVFNSYQNSFGSTSTFENNVKAFTNLLSTDGFGATKPLGIVEWGSTGFGTTAETDYINSAKSALDANDSTISRIKMYMIYDANDGGCTPVSSTCSNFRVGFDDAGNPSSTRAAAYYSFADDARFTNAFYNP